MIYMTTVNNADAENLTHRQIEKQNFIQLTKIKLAAISKPPLKER
jgi:hypothetical protein